MVTPDHALVIVQAFNPDGLVQWGVDNLLRPALFIIGFGIIVAAKKLKWADAGTTVGLVILGCVVIAGGAFFYDIGEAITNAAGGGGGAANGGGAGNHGKP